MLIDYVHVLLLVFPYTVNMYVSSISYNFNTISELNGFNFNIWNENVMIVLKHMDLNHAFRIGQPQKVMNLTSNNWSDRTR